MLETIKLKNNTGFRPASKAELLRLCEHLTLNSLLEISIAMEIDNITELEKYVSLLYKESAVYVVHDSEDAARAALILRPAPSRKVTYVALLIGDGFYDLHYDFLKIGKRVFEQISKAYDVAITRGFYRNDVSHVKFLEFFKFRLLSEDLDPRTKSIIYTYVRSF